MEMPLAGGTGENHILRATRPMREDVRKRRPEAGLPRAVRASEQVVDGVLLEQEVFGGTRPTLRHDGGKVGNPEHRLDLPAEGNLGRGRSFFILEEQETGYDENIPIRADSFFNTVTDDDEPYDDIFNTDGEPHSENLNHKRKNEVARHSRKSCGGGKCR